MMNMKMAKGGSCGTKGYAKGGITEYGGKEKYSSKGAMMRHEKSESPMMERKEGMMAGGMTKGYAKGGMTRGDGCCMKGHTKGKMV